MMLLKLINCMNLSVMYAWCIYELSTCYRDQLISTDTSIWLYIRHSADPFLPKHLKIKSTNNRGCLNPGAYCIYRCTTINWQCFHMYVNVNKGYKLMFNTIFFTNNLLFIMWFLFFRALRLFLNEKCKHCQFCSVNLYIWQYMSWIIF